MPRRRGRRSALALTGSAKIEGWPNGFFLDGDRIAVISAVPPARDPNTGVGICPMAGAAMFSPMRASGWPPCSR
jgi:hypothetical protein